MRNLYTLLIALFISVTIHAQIIDFPDANFKNALVNTNCVSTCFGSSPDMDADTNDDGEITVSEAEAITGLHVNGQSISSLVGIENFINLNCLDISNNSLTSLNINDLSNLSTLNCDNNQLTSLEINNMFNLTTIHCSYNQLTSIDIINTDGLLELYCIDNQLTNLDVNLTGLTVLNCNQNQLTNLNVSGLFGLAGLYCNQNQLTSLTLGDIGYLETLECRNNLLTSIDLSKNTLPLLNFNASNNQLTKVFLKNGLDDTEYLEVSGGSVFFDLSNNPNLTYICADREEIDALELHILEQSGITNCLVNSYCSFEPGGDFFTVEGITKIDFNANGCDINDSIYSNLKYSINDGTETIYYISNTSGAYTSYLLEGSYIITPFLENLNSFNISPSSLSVSFPNDASPYMQDFCIEPNEIINDLEIVLIPITQAQAGFEAKYKLIFKNKGTTTRSGYIEFIFSDNLNVSSFIFSSSSEDSIIDGIVTWSFSDLEPFETNEIDITLNLNTPTDPNFPLNGGDVLSYNAKIFPVTDDETPIDNGSSLRQTVVNSFDPNDKTCLEGDFITPEMVGEYVHYMIRFENTGTADAINIVVKDDIDTSKYDLSSLVPLHASHNYVARIKDNATEHYVEFIFENINLPFDDANNDGYIVFKIKTLDTLVLNDAFENDAEIYFDFNFPIITNTESTTVGTLSTEEFEFDNSMSLYPNPTTDVLTLESQQAIKQVTIYDMSGRLIKEIAVIGFKTETTFYTKDLSAGTYFVKIKTIQGEAVRKIIKD